MLTRRKDKNKSESDAKFKKLKSSTNDKKPSDRWIFLMKDDVIDNQEENMKPTICKLRHPRLKTGVMYLLAADCTAVYELTSFQEKFRSWFIGDSVISDGQIILTTPLDPLFLILPYIINSGKASRFMTIEQIVLDEEFPESHKLLTCCSTEQLELIAESKDIDDDMRVYKYSQDKTLEWLKKKTEAVTEILELKKIQVSGGKSHSSIFIPSGQSEVSKDAYLQFAFGIVTEYLSLELEAELKTYLGITSSNDVTSPSAAENEPPNKKQRLSSEVTPLEDYTLGKDIKKDTTKTKLSLAQKQLNKVDKTGMKSMLSFFSPKPAK